MVNRAAVRRSVIPPSVFLSADYADYTDEDRDVRRRAAGRRTITTLGCTSGCVFNL
jgi:hypothetical protein